MRADCADRAEHRRSAIAYAFNTTFQRVLQSQMDYFNNPESDKISRLQGQIGEVREVMVENIEKVLARGEKIELLVERTDGLNEASNTFKNHSRTLKRTMWWQNAKMNIIIGLVILVALWLLLSIICGFDFSKCKKKKN